MKPKLKFLLVPVLVWLGFFALPVAQTGCTSGSVTLAPGGAYTDPVRYQLDKVISDADGLATALLGWYDTNRAFLSKWPEIGNVAETVRANENKWIKDAYAAEDAYLAAAAAYKAGTASLDGVTAAQARFAGTLSLLKNLTTQLAAYQAAHPHAS